MPPFKRSNMKYTPKPQNKKANAAAAVFFATAAAAYAAGATKIAYPALFRFAALLAVTAAVYTLVRYKYTTITYIIAESDRENDSDFIVVKAQGRREGITECRLYLSDLKRIVPTENGRISRNDKRELIEQYGSVKIYNYTVSIRSDDRIALIFDDDGDAYAVIIEPDAQMRLCLEAAARKSSAL